MISKTLCFLLCSLPLLCADTPVRTKVYKVNLDLPEEERWTHILKDYPHLKNDLENVIKKTVPQPALPLVETIAASLESYFASPFAGEMRGIAKAAKIGLGDVLLINIFYEISTYCTSIVVQDNNGQIWHARNLDFVFTDMLRNTTITMDFQKNNKTVYTGTGTPGLVGLFTGQKPFGFTVTQDTREGGSWWMNVLMAILFRKAQISSFMIRSVLGKAHAFSTAVTHYSRADTVSELYLIVGGTGPGQGAVISKGRIGSDNVWYLDPDHGRWFLVETNYDHWTSPPPSDDRRDPAIKALKATGQGNINVKSLFKVLSLTPVHNHQTVYSIVMRAADPNVYQAYVRHYP